MKCPVQAGGNAEILLDYCAHTLDVETVTLLETHMEGCPDCRAFRDAQSQLWTTLDHWRTVPLSSDFDRRLYRNIEREKQKPWWRQWRVAWAAISFEPAMPIATAALLVLAGFLFQVTSPIAPFPPEQARTELRADSVDMEQVARDLEDMDMLAALPALLSSEDIGPRI